MAQQKIDLKQAEANTQKLLQELEVGSKEAINLVGARSYIQELEVGSKESINLVGARSEIPELHVDPKSYTRSNKLIIFIKCNLFEQALHESLLFPTFNSVKIDST